MTINNSPSSKETDKNSSGTAQRRKKLFVLAGVCFLCVMLLFFPEIPPRHITFPTLPPNHLAEEGDWLHTTYSVRSESPGRSFIWRREAVIGSGQSWGSIIEYFDGELGNKGWIRINVWGPCIAYLPEAHFLESGKNGYVTYFRSDQGIDDFSDIVCLAVWKSDIDDEPPFVYNIVILTARSSLFKRIVDNLFSD